MKQVSIRPVWTIQDPSGPVLPARLIELLVHVAETGSLLQAARQLATERYFLLPVTSSCPRPRCHGC